MTSLKYCTYIQDSDDNKLMLGHGILYKSDVGYLSKNDSNGDDCRSEFGRGGDGCHGAPQYRGSVHLHHRNAHHRNAHHHNAHHRSGHHRGDGRPGTRI